MTDGGWPGQIECTFIEQLRYTPPMPPHNPKDPWGTGEREAYRPPPPAKRVVKKEEFSFFRLLKTLLTIAVLLLGANYVWKNYLSSGR